MKANRDALDALLAEMAVCRTLLAFERAILQQATANHLERRKSCADALVRLADRIGMQGKDDAVRQTEPMEAVRQVAVAVTGLSDSLDVAGAECNASVRAGLATLGGTLERITGVSENQARQLLAVTDSVSALSAFVAALRLEAHGKQAGHARTRQTRTLGDLVKAAALFGARMETFERVLARHRTGFRLHRIVIPLLLGCAFFLGLMTGFVIRFFQGAAGNSVRPAMELLPWLLPEVTPA